MSETSEQPTSAPGISEDEAKKYVAELRSAPAEQIVTDLLLSAINTAQVKLGQEDARVFIDLAAAMLENVREHVAEEVAKQIEQALGQLRLAQVQAEAEAKQGANGGQGGTAGSSGSAATPSQPGTDLRSGQASKLWVPGRD